ncbi:MAG: lipoyl(octanoyl) transferase LipB [Methylophilaceae bacterium]
MTQPKTHALALRNLGRTDYAKTLAAMQAFTNSRDQTTLDELWLTEHDSIYTLGLNRRDVRLPTVHHIPIVYADRGGKITYHGPGQLVIYLLIDLNRRKLKVRQLVTMIENSIIALLAPFNVHATAMADAPGVYVNTKKIASIGLRLKKNVCYHGLSLNVNMDLSPFKAIDPCGYVGLEMTQTYDLGITQTPQQLGEALLELLKNKLNP